jgi:PIN domain nuclease of toxin-antitoxin system
MRKNVKGFGLIDALIVAKQAEKKCRIVSGDQHFENVKNVLFIG